MTKQNDSDPLPYVQVDRAVKPKATLLASVLGVTPQHALGSLVEWWELCGDPRDLERIVVQTPVGDEPRVLLSGEDVSLRFHLASGHRLEPVVLERIGLLESVDDRYRVRGMSRFFEPICKRLAARSAASIGGKASAEARRKSHGTAQPEGGKGSKNGSDGRSDVAQAASEPEPKREPKRNGSGDRSANGSATEADPKPSGQRSAVSSIKEDLSTSSSATGLRSKRAPKVKPQKALPLEPTAENSDDSEEEPERKLSEWLEALEHFESARTVAAREFGLIGADERLPEEPVDPRRINAMLSKAAKLLSELQGYPVAGVDLGDYFDAFGSNERFATYDPPWPLVAFCHPGTLAICARAVRSLQQPEWSDA